MFHKKREAVKFNVDFDVIAIENLPPKYNKFRILLTRGAKVKKTNEIRASDCKARPPAADASLRFTTTLERSADGFGFEEKTYKLSLLRINNRATLHKEKKIGSVYVNLAEYAVRRDSGTEESKLALSISDNSSPAWVSISVLLSTGKGGRYYDDHSDGYSEASGLHTTAETVSHATSLRSLGSIDEDEQQDVEVGEEEEHPLMREDRNGKEESSTELPPSLRDRDTASKGSVTSKSQHHMDEQLQELAAQLKRALSALAKASKEQEQAEKRRERVEAKATEARARRAGLQAHHAVARETIELLETDRDEIARGREAMEAACAAEKAPCAAEKATLLRGEKRRMQGRAERAGREVEEARAGVEGGRGAVVRAHRALRAAWEEAERGEGREGGGREGGQRSAEEEAEAVAEVRKTLHRERARADKYAGWLKTTTAEKEALEEQVAELRGNAAMKRGASSEQGKGRGGRGQAAFVKTELDRVTSLLMATSTSHAEAALAHGELQLQARKLQAVNAQLQARVLKMEATCRHRGL